MDKAERHFLPPTQVQGTIFPVPNFNPMMDVQMLGSALQGIGLYTNLPILLQLIWRRKRPLSITLRFPGPLPLRYTAIQLKTTESVRLFMNMAVGNERYIRPVNITDVGKYQRDINVRRDFSDRNNNVLILTGITSDSGLKALKLLTVPPDRGPRGNHLACHLKPQKLLGAFRGTLQSSSSFSILSRKISPTPTPQNSLKDDLITELKENLSSHFKDVMVGLMYTPPSYDAHELWRAMKGAGIEENCLIDILASRTNGEIFQMKEAYCLQYNSDLQRDCYSVTPGHFRDTIMNLVQGIWEEYYADPVMAAQDAVVLWEACQQKTGEHKNMLQMILCNKSYQHLWMVFQEFQNISGQDLVDAINECYNGYFQELLIALVLCVRDKPAYFAYRLHRAIHRTTPLSAETGARKDYQEKETENVLMITKISPE
ncbi:annexin A10 [Tachyglossus aculeatus]|uniref:annexin A10 n=1 Tax=Tachyglossus aculeatus TaxID=9261 RepID=UPI0018F5D028|nr:annexin A10 [Tachyglossus aculeatus]